MPMSQVTKNLKAARRLITPVSKWCKHALARDKNGNSLSTYGNLDIMQKDAHSFCARGALLRVKKISPHDFPFWFDAIGAEDRLLSKAVNGGCPVHTNNYGTHEEVLAMFDKAIELSKAQDKALA